MAPPATASFGLIDRHPFADQTTHSYDRLVAAAVVVAVEHLVAVSAPHLPSHCVAFDVAAAALAVVVLVLVAHEIDAVTVYRPLLS